MATVAVAVMGPAIEAEVATVVGQGDADRPLVHRCRSSSDHLASSSRSVPKRRSRCSLARLNILCSSSPDLDRL